MVTKPKLIVHKGSYDALYIMVYMMPCYEHFMCFYFDFVAIMSEYLRANSCNFLNNGHINQNEGT